MTQYGKTEAPSKKELKVRADMNKNAESRYSGAQIEEFFKNGDTTKDGKLSNTELYNVLVKLDPSITPQTVRAYIEVYDVSKVDRFIQLDEFRRLMAGLFPK